MMILTLWTFAILAVVLGVYILARAGDTQFRSFGLCMVSVGVYCGGYGGELSSVGIAGMLAWSKVQYMGVALMPAFWVEFVVRYTGRGALFRQGLFRVLIWVIPVLTVIFRLFDEYLGLIYIDPALDAKYNTLTFTRGIWYYVNLSFTYGSGICGLLMLAMYSELRGRIFRKHAMLLMLATLFPYVASFLYQSGNSPWGSLDLTPFSLAATTFVVYLAVVHQNIINLTTVANDFIVEKLPVAIFVFDRMHNLCEANESARALLALGNDCLGRNVTELFPPEVAARLLPEGGKTSFEQSVNGREQDVRTYILDRKDKGRVGWIVTMSDISERKRMERRLEQMSRI